jgi:hypothetical protein
MPGIDAEVIAAWVTIAVAGVQAVCARMTRPEQIAIVHVNVTLVYTEACVGPRGAVSRSRTEPVEVKP